MTKCRVHLHLKIVVEAVELAKDFLPRRKLAYQAPWAVKQMDLTLDELVQPDEACDQPGVDPLV